MSLPRSLSLRKTETGWRLLQRPVKELQTLRGQHRRVLLEKQTGRGDLSRLDSVTADVFEVEADIEPGPKSVFEIALRTGVREVTVLRVDVPGRKLTLDRTRSGKVDFHKQFPGKATAPLGLIAGRVKLHLFVDTSSVEVFANDSEVVLTSLILPSAGPRHLELRVDQGELRRANVGAWKLASAWADKPAKR
jgi:fructan beta-fructosidase